MIEQTNATRCRRPLAGQEAPHVAGVPTRFWVNSRCRYPCLKNSSMKQGSTRSSSEIHDVGVPMRFKSSLTMQVPPHRPHTMQASPRGSRVPSRYTCTFATLKSTQGASVPTRYKSPLTIRSLHTVQEPPHNAGSLFAVTGFPHDADVPMRFWRPAPHDVGVSSRVSSRGSRVNSECRCLRVVQESPQGSSVPARFNRFPQEVGVPLRS